jgi:hypothetical protein
MVVLELLNLVGTKPTPLYAEISAESSTIIGTHESPLNPNFSKQRIMVFDLIVCHDIRTKIGIHRLQQGFEGHGEIITETTKMTFDFAMPLKNFSVLVTKIRISNEFT